MAVAAVRDMDLGSTTAPSGAIGQCDSRISLHVHDTPRKGATSILVRTVDTDVVVIVVGVFYCLVHRYPDVDLWVAFGARKHVRYYHINSVCLLELGEDKCQALPVFHAFTRCDMTSQFNGKEKKSAWKTWKSLPSVTEAFTTASSSAFVPHDTSSPVFSVIDQFNTCATMFDNEYTTMTHVHVTQLQLKVRLSVSGYLTSRYVYTFTCSLYVVYGASVSGCNDVIYCMCSGHNSHAHTCSCTLELSCTYGLAQELKREFLAILRDPVCFQVSMV